MRKLLSLVVLVGMCTTFTWGQEAKSKELKRVDAATKVLGEIQATPDKGIPQEIMAASDCVVVIPSMLKGGLGFGAEYGRGISTCRTEQHAANAWSAPAPVRVEGGSWGLQIGGQAVDVVMLVMNRQGMQHLLQSKFAVGVDASAAAGPVGRHAAADTDWKMRSELLTYSRARGAFAGVALNGAVVKQDTDDTIALYGKSISFEQILTGKVAPPEGTQQFLAEVHKYFGEAKAAEREAKTTEPAGTGKSTPSRAESTTGGMTGSATAESHSDMSGQASTTGNVGASTQTGTSTAPATTTETTGQSSATSSGNASSEQVRANIMDVLRDTPNLSASNVSVDVNDNQVVLSGSVPNQSDKATIRRLAQQNAGGRTVVDDNLVVK